jgi:hypothetical protein
VDCPVLVSGLYLEYNVILNYVALLNIEIRAVGVDPYNVTKIHRQMFGLLDLRKVLL